LSSTNSNPGDLVAGARTDGVRGHFAGTVIAHVRTGDFSIYIIVAVFESCTAT